MFKEWGSCRGSGGVSEYREGVGGAWFVCYYSEVGREIKNAFKADMSALSNIAIALN